MCSLTRALVGALLGSTLSVTACAPVDGDATATASADLILAASAPLVCTSSPQTIACNSTALRQRRDDGLTYVATTPVSTTDPVDPIRRTCAVTSDCLAAALPTNSCGGYRFVGINASSLAAFNTKASQCNSLYVPCSPVVLSNIADDGRTWTSKAIARVACCSGYCVTAAPL